MWIPLLIWTLHFMNFTKGPDNAKILRFRRSSSVSRLCATGCETCSALNGCLSCKPRLFFHLELDGMKQRGTCLSSCPRGHYGTRSPRINTCTRCKDDCAFCFSENFCTRCHPGHFLFRGKCESSCPNGLTPNTALGECTVSATVPAQVDLSLMHSSSNVTPKCTVRWGNGQIGVRAFGKRLFGNTGGEKRRVPDKSCRLQV
ncbi:R-spondin-3-like isoform X2 [Anabas testudineus]|uniref:R-spondin-3-like isoform X2 n=1 Tax=Anabas testudineus TaxID=64144 RepID=UPI000E463F3B|nr:R-spondin-3-like isoform X2 [Anabas testudineus]